MTVSDIENLLIAALPSLTAILGIVISCIKFIGKFTKTDTHIQETIEKIMAKEDMDDKLIDEYKKALASALADNKELKDQLAELLTEITKVRHEPPEA